MRSSAILQVGMMILKPLDVDVAAKGDCNIPELVRPGDCASEEVQKPSADSAHTFM